jgi:Ca2+-binding EF-hand superfamily protein
VNQLITKEDRNKLLSQFQSFDKNNDGVLNREEILFGYKKIYGEAFDEKDVVKITFLLFFI